jgi:putative membrane protein
METKKRIKQYFYKLYDDIQENNWVVWIFGIGLLLHLIPTTRESIIALTPLTLFGTLAYMLWSIKKKISLKTWIWIISAYLITFALEAIGVETGTIFGTYLYGDVFGIKLFDTPILIGFLWIIVLWGALQFMQSISSHKVDQVLGTAILIVLFDIILEPVAIALGYWSWLNDIIPMQNYIAWGVIGLVLSTYAVLLPIKTKSRIPLIFFLTFFIFMIVLRYTIV